MTTRKLVILGKTMNNYFINITKALNFKSYEYYDTMNMNGIISTFQNHICIKKIKEYFPDASNNNFEFTEVYQDNGKSFTFYI